MKKSVIIIIFLIFNGLIFLNGFNNNKNIRHNSYLKEISKKDILEKTKQILSWEKNQIESDFKVLKKSKISTEALDKTFLKIRENLPDHVSEFGRYRIINNKIYRFYPDKIFYKKEVTALNAFEKTLRTLSRLVALPNVDIIVSSQDGTPLSFVKSDFYLVKDCSRQAPIFSFAKEKGKDYVILIPDGFSLSEPWFEARKEVNNKVGKYSWNKKNNSLFWRGQLSKNARVKLCEISKKNELYVDAGFGVKSLMNEEVMRLKDIENYRNVFLENYKGFVSLEDQLAYKYLLVIDGLMCSYPGYQWRLLSNSVVFKQDSDEVQWFYSALKPYVHYIPVSEDFSDVVEKVKWAIANDKKCFKIAQNSTEFAAENLNVESIFAYLYKVLVEYQKYQLFDKKFLRKDTRNNSNWICIQNRKRASKIAKKKSCEIKKSLF